MEPRIVIIALLACQILAAIVMIALELKNRKLRREIKDITIMSDAVRYTIMSFLEKMTDQDQGYQVPSPDRSDTKSEKVKAKDETEENKARANSQEQSDKSKSPNPLTADQNLLIERLKGGKITQHLAKDGSKASLYFQMGKEAKPVNIKSAKFLEMKGIVSIAKVVDTDKGSVIRYELTQKGKAL